MSFTGSFWDCPAPTHPGNKEISTILWKTPPCQPEAELWKLNQQNSHLTRSIPAPPSHIPTSLPSSQTLAVPGAGVGRKIIQIDSQMGVGEGNGLSLSYSRCQNSSPAGPKQLGRRKQDGNPQKILELD